MKSTLNQSITIIAVGLVGCLLTSMAGIAAVMLSYGWAAAGGWREWLHRLGIAYPAASILVLVVFPWLVPRLSALVERQLVRSAQLPSH
jgi:hypothetical protein